MNPGKDVYLDSFLCHNHEVMRNITLQITEDELREMTEAYRVLQNFLAKIVSPNELYTDEFLSGLQEAQVELKNNDFAEVRTFADLVQ